MAKRIEAWGNVLEFPDDMPDADIAAAIQKNEAHLNPEASTFTKAKSAVSSGIDAGLSMLTPKRSIADQAQETPAQPANAARIQRSGNIVSKALASSEPVPEEGGFINSAGRTIGQNIKGAGQIGADYIPGVGQDNAVKQYGQSVIDANPTAVNSLEDIANNPGTAVTEATGNAAPSMAGMVGARALGQGITALSPLAGPAAPVVAAVGQVVSWLGPAAVASLPSYGGIRDKQILNDPKNEESAKAKAIAALGAGAVGAIETSFGPQNWALAAMTKEGREQLAKKFAATTLAGSAAKGTGKGMFAEGGEEIIQNPIEQLASFDNPTTKENIKDTLFGGAMGAIGGGVLGGGTGAVTHIAGKPVTEHSDRVLRYTAQRGGERAKAAAQAELNRRATEGVDPAIANAPESTVDAVDRIIATGKDKAGENHKDAATTQDSIQSDVFDETPDSPTPEPVETLDAQLKSLADGNKPGMLLTPGEPLPGALPEGVKSAEIPGRGTLLYRDEETLKAATEGRIGEALGYGIDEKPAGADQVVTSRDEKGTVIQDVATDGSKSVLQSAKNVAGPGGSVEIRPIEHAITEREANTKTKDGLSNLLGKVAKREAMENQGRAALDELEERDGSPATEAKKFWSDTYFKLPAKAQATFTQLLKGHTGMEPGVVVSVDRDGKVEHAKDWQDVAGQIDLPNSVENLEGTDRGFVALMADANRRFALSSTETQPTTSQITLPDSTVLPTQWDVVDADSVTASLKEGVNQPRDRSRAASDVQVQGIANKPDYRRLSDSPVMDIGAPTLSVDGHIVGGNGRFEGVNRAYDQGSAGEYLSNLKADAVAKGIDPAKIDGMKKPVLVRRITQPFDTRKLAVASNSGTSLQYSGLELAKIDAERMKGLENLDVTDNGEIALTGSNIQNVRHSLGDYSAAELGALTDKDGRLSQEGVRRIRNAMLYAAYGSNPTLERMVESTDNDMRNISGALIRAAGSATKVRADIKAGTIPAELDISEDIVTAVETLSKIKAQGMSVDEHLAQVGMFGEELSDSAKQILRVLETNMRSQKKIAEFVKSYYDAVAKLDLASGDMFGNSTPDKQGLLNDSKERITDKPLPIQDLFARPVSSPGAESRPKSPDNDGTSTSGQKDKQVTPPVSPKEEAAPEPVSKSTELPGARPLVESLIKRRAAAKQGGKDLSNAIDRAKEVMAGTRAPSTVEHRYFRLQAKAFERADSNAAAILGQIADLINPKQPKKAGLSVPEVEKHIAPLQKAGTKKVKVAATEADLPKNIQDAIKSAGAAGVRGVYYPQTDEIWLVADKLNDGDEAIMVTLHEARHRGLRKMFGAGVDPIMRQIYATNKRVRDAADVAIKTNKGMSKEEATEEVLADMAINKTANTLNGWKRLVQFIQKWLTDHGINLTFTDAMVESLVAGAETVGASDSQTDTPAFKKWFGNSRMVNKEGKPRMVYHGTPDATFNIFKPETYFSDNGDIASIYTSTSASSIATSAKAGDAPAVYPVYLKIEKPFDTRDPKTRKIFKNEYFMKFGTGTDLQESGLPDWNDARDLAEWIESEGKDYDGLILEEGGIPQEDGTIKARGVSYVPLYGGSQVKSAIGNNGNFDARNPDIRFSRAGQNASWDSPEPSKLDNLIYVLQNKHVDLKRVVEAIKTTGEQLADQWNTYLQEELFHGRAAKRTQDFVNRELKPIMLGMKLRGQTVEELDKYLHARHAEEANNLIAQRDPNMPDGGSGMTTKDAKDYLANLPTDKRAALENTAKKIDAVIAATRNLYVSYGLIDQETADSWQQMFKNYVPLMREDHDGGMGIGQGFSIKGKEAKHRTGSKRKVVDILANIALQRERAIVRGEKNRVAVSLAGLAKLNPNPEFWTFDKVPTEKVLNEATGQVEDRPVPMFKNRDNVIVAKVKDSKGNVIERAVIFNEQDERAMRMAQAMKNLDATQLEGLIGVSAMITRYFAAINTQYNPIFGVINLTRDLQASLLNLSSTAIAGHKAQVLKNIGPAVVGIYRASRANTKGKAQVHSPMADLWDEMQKEGGMTGYRDLFKTSEDRADAIKNELDPTAWMNSGLGKVFTAGGTLKVPLAVAQKKAKWIFDWLSDYNQTLEGAMRLSVYKTAIDNGVSKPRSASIAKNISVNFNRKGQSGQQAGALYAFFNAAMQGTARIGETMTTMEKGDIKTFKFNRAGKTIIIGGITLGAMQALALAAAGFDDDEPPEFIRERNLIIPIGDKKYITIPMPLGFHAIPNIGRLSTEFALGGFKKPIDYTAKLFSVFAEAFNPIGNAGMSIQTLAPTAIDPLVALAENKDWTGKPIAKEDFNKLSPTPGFSRNKDTASDPSKWIAEAINTISGGNKYVPGVASPTADQIDYLFGQVTGGVGRETAKAEQSIKAMATGEDLPPHKIPLVGRFYGDSSGQTSQGNAFYSNLKRINEVEAELKGRRKDRLPVDEFKSENPEYRLVVRANLIERLVSKQRKIKSDLIKKDAPREQVKAVDERITKLMTGLNDRVKTLKQEQQTAN